MTLEEDDTIATAYQVVRKMYPKLDQEGIRRETTNLVAQGAEHVADLYKRIIQGGQPMRNTGGAPAAPFAPPPGERGDMTEEDAIKWIEETATPKDRRTLKHIQLMRAKGQVPWIKGVPRP